MHSRANDIHQPGGPIDDSSDDGSQLIPKAPVEETVKETGRIMELGSGSTRDLTSGGAWNHEDSDAASLSDGTIVVGNGDALVSGIELAGAQGGPKVGALYPQAKIVIDTDVLTKGARVGISCRSLSMALRFTAGCLWTRFGSTIT